MFALTVSEWIDAVVAIATAIAVVIAAFALRTSTRVAKNGAKVAEASAKSAKATELAAEATASSADATARAAGASERLLAAQTLPLLVEVPRGEKLPQARRISVPLGEREVTSVGEVVFESYDYSGPLSVPLQNIGTGVARATRVSATADASTYGRQQIGSTVLGGLDVYIRPGEDEYVTAYTHGDKESKWLKIALEKEQGGHPMFHVWFEDFAGVQHFELKAEIAQVPIDPPEWRVTSCQVLGLAPHDAASTDD
jgi:hypothetical protein